MRKRKYLRDPSSQSYQNEKEKRNHYEDTRCEDRHIEKKTKQVDVKY